MEPSRLDKPLKILTFAMVFLGVLSIVLTGYLPSPQPIIATAVLLVGFLFWKSRIHNQAYSIIWHIITFLFLAWCCHGLFTHPFPGEDLTGRIPMGAMQLSIFLQIFKVYNHKTDRDYAHMFLLSFFQFISSAGVSVEFYLLPLLLLYVAVAMWALTLFHFRRQLKSQQAAVPPHLSSRAARTNSGRLLTARFYGGTLLASVLVALMGTFLFIFFPRSAASDNPLLFRGVFRGLGGRLSSGMSDSIDLGIAGIIYRDATPVMRAAFRTLRQPPHAVLWRRGALHRYDDRKKRWSRPVELHRSADAMPRSGPSLSANILVRKSPGLFVAASEFDKYNSVNDLRNDPRLIEQRYTLFRSYNMAPIFSAFCAPVAVVADVRAITCDVNQSYRSDQRTRRNFTYTVFSRGLSQTSPPSTADSAIQAPPHLSEAKRSLYVQLPPDLSPKFKELALHITQTAPTDYEKARAIRNYLTLNCRYSLDLTWRSGRRGPLYDFLFANKPGHCEYFASAMVILLRELGIPSRPAYGFSTGRWNPQSNSFEVRRLDAHAWAEVFINGRGWMHFDPTPPLPDDDTPDTFLSILFTPFTNFLTLCRAQWARGVVGYSRSQQKVVFRSVAGAFKSISRRVTEYAFSVRSALHRSWNTMTRNLFLRFIFALTAAALLLALGAGMIRFKRRRHFRLIYRKRHPPPGHRVRVKFYERMLFVLMKKGITKKPADTALEFAERIASADGPFSGVKTLTDFYYFVRFGNGMLTPDQSRTVQTILGQLTRSSPREIRAS